MADVAARTGSRSTTGWSCWVAEADGEMVAAGRLEPVAGTRVRRRLGRGDAATVAGPRPLPCPDRRPGTLRARRWARRLIQSDSTEFSRPILERSGLVKVSTTTPYEWHR